ncbi:Thioesterase [Penicillium freii]|uniref:Uncharacterized protein n=1 Tax=Penicillium freii TaxID=48697 RepID=A0A124GSM0_PENFR|nr:Thioesterase [Penicillium freii]KUM64836.1 hypothetical protein ACN42_g2229 [Penicillium freii]
MSTLHTLMRTVILFISARPRVLPLSPGRLEKTTLGKLSRPKIQNALARGKYKDLEIFKDRVLEAYRESHCSEHKLVAGFKETLGLDKEIDIDMPILDTGITLVDFGIEDIPMFTIMINTTIRSLAAAVQKLKASYLTSVYQTVVTLQPHGSKTPLWLFHVEVGKILVFLMLAQHFPDRPIFTMRPHVFNLGEQTF